MFIDSQAASEKLLGIGVNVFIGQDSIDGLILDFSQEIFFILGTPGRISKEHLIEDDSKRPDVAFI